MAQPYVGEIRMFAGNFPPQGWMFCDGQTLPISENETLFQLIGTTYGGDGQETFNLPNLQSRVPIHMGTNAGVTYQLAEMAGVESVTLTVQQIPTHTHPWLASGATATSQDPGNQVLATAQAQTYFNIPDNLVNLSPLSVGPVGGSQPHDNMQPFQCINYIISLFGIFPSQT
jgi:microcystin-dependent protein